MSFSCKALIVLTTSTSWDILSPKRTWMVSLACWMGLTQRWYPWKRFRRRVSSISAKDTNSLWAGQIHRRQLLESWKNKLLLPASFFSVCVLLISLTFTTEQMQIHHLHWWPGWQRGRAGPRGSQTTCRKKSGHLRWFSWFYIVDMRVTYETALGLLI